MNVFFSKHKILLLCGIYFFISSFLFIFLFDAEGLISPDTASYVNTAQNILQKCFFSIDGITPDYSRTPGYPLFLAFIYLVGGNNTLVIFIQILLATLELYLFYKILCMLNTPKNLTSLGPVLLYFNITTYQYSWSILSDFFFGFLITLSLYFLVRHFYVKHSFSDLIFFTFSLNYALLVRPILFYFNIFVLIIILLFWLCKKLSLKYVFIFGLCFALCWGGWSYRNYKHSGVFIFSTISNFHMMKYNCPPITTYLENISEKESQIHHDLTFAQKYPEANKLNDAQLSLLQKTYGIEFIKAHFGTFVWLSFLGLLGTLFGPSKTFIFATFPFIPAFLTCGIYTLYLGCVYILYLVGLIKNYKSTCNLIQVYIFLLSSYLAIPGAIMCNSRFRVPFFTLIVIGTILNISGFSSKQNPGKPMTIPTQKL